MGEQDVGDKLTGGRTGVKHRDIWIIRNPNMNNARGVTGETKLNMRFLPKNSLND